jgi:hypothetical protein
MPDRSNPEWGSYEELAQELMQVVAASDGSSTLRLERNVTVTAWATQNQIDVLWEFRDRSDRLVRLLSEHRSRGRRITNRLCTAATRRRCAGSAALARVGRQRLAPSRHQPCCCETRRSESAGSRDRIRPLTEVQADESYATRLSRNYRVVRAVLDDSGYGSVLYWL